MGDRLRMPRSRGNLIGALLLLAGLWGATIPFTGPYFDWVIGPDNAWDMTAGRFWLSLVPGLAVIAGALILAGASNRLSGGVGAWMALAGGAWFVVGPTVSRLWNGGETIAGTPLGDTGRQAFETLTYFEGLGALIVALSALALGRMTILATDEQRESVVVLSPGPGDSAPETRTGTGRFTRAREETPVPEADEAVMPHRG